MSYYQSLGLSKEPFTSSPDPLFFFRSKTHRSAITQLEIAIRLKRGLSIVFGDVGTGKTTLSRALIQSFQEDDRFDFYLIIDSSFQSEFQFLNHLAHIFKITVKRRTQIEVKRAIQDFLFEKHSTEDKTIILIIDESQKLSLPMLEILRVLLNYETNECKLLQLILFSQLELIPKVKQTKNLLDRIYLKYILKPLEPDELKNMIQFRLDKAGWPKDKTLFLPDSLDLLIHHSKGSLRFINQICHKSLLKMIAYEKERIDVNMIQEVIEEEEIFAHAG